MSGNHGGLLAQDAVKLGCAVHVFELTLFPHSLAKK